MRAIVKHDYSAAMQFLLHSIYEFKLGSFDAWDKGLSVALQDECLQRSQGFLYAIKAYLAGKTAENAAQKALFSGDHSTQIDLCVLCVFVLPCGAHDTHACCARSNDHLLCLL